MAVWMKRSAFAVGARGVGPGAAMLQAELVAGTTEAVSVVARSVVGENAAGLDAELAEPRRGSSQEVSRAAIGLVRVHRREGQPRVIIDRHMQELGAEALDPVAAVSSTPVR